MEDLSKEVRVRSGHVGWFGKTTLHAKFLRLHSIILHAQQHEMKEEVGLLSRKGEGLPVSQ